MEFIAVRLIFVAFLVCGVIAVCAAVIMAAERSEQGRAFKLMCRIWCVITLLCDWASVGMSAGIMFGITVNPFYPSHRGLAVLFMALTQMSLVITATLFFTLFCQRKPVLCYIPLLCSAVIIAGSINSMLPAWG